MEVQSNRELKKRPSIQNRIGQKRSLLCSFWEPSTPCFSYLANDRQDVFKYNGLKMSGVIKGETVNANELF